MVLLGLLAFGLAWAITVPAALSAHGVIEPLGIPMMATRLIGFAPAIAALIAGAASRANIAVALRRGSGAAVRMAWALGRGAAATRLSYAKSFVLDGTSAAVDLVMTVAIAITVFAIALFDSEPQFERAET